MQRTFDISFPGRTIYGDGAIQKLGAILTGYGFSHSVLLMDEGIKRSGIGAIVLEQLQGSVERVSIIDDLAREPSDIDVNRVLGLVKQYNPDNVVALGGGSVLDVAKLCSVLITSGKDILDLLNGGKVPAHTTFTTLIPTTSGTGAEATKNSIIAISAKKTKVAVVHENLLPDLVVLDPRLTVKMPVAITTTTGMDALCHAMECFLSKKANEMSDMFAINAIERIATSLRKVTIDGDDIEARSDMLLASYYAGTCITLSGTNAVHALSYPLGTLFHIPHGHSNAILLPFVMEKNLAALPEKCKVIASAFGYDPEENKEKPIEYLTRELHQLLQDLAINASLGDFGVKRKDVGNLVEIAHGNRRLMDNNPIDFTKEEIEEIYLRLLGEIKE